MSASSLFRSRTRGSTTCCRLNKSSCRVSSAARVPALRISSRSLAERVALLQLGKDEAAVAQDHREHVVEVVRYAPGEAAHRLHLLRVSELSLRLAQGRLAPLSFGQIGREGNALGEVEHCDTDEHGQARAILSQELLLPRARDASAS